MSLISDAEIRYTSISMIALIIITRVLNFMALRDSAFTPTERAGETVNWSNLSFGSVSEIANSLNTVIANITIVSKNLTNVLDGWVFLVDTAGWASVFVLIPSLVMFFIILNTTYQIAKALPYT